MAKQVASGGRGAERLDAGQPFIEHPLATVGAIGTQILPITPVAKKASTFSAITRESILRPRNVRRNGGAAFARDTFDTDEVSYTCKGYGFEVPVEAANRAVYANDFDADMISQAMCRRVLDLEREKRIAAAIFNTTTWPSGTAALYTDVTTDWDTATATIISDVDTAAAQVRTNCGMMPNTLVISAAHLASLNKNTGIIARFPGIAQLDRGTLLSALPAIFSIPRVLIGAAVKNTAEEGATISLGNVWSDDYCWIGVCAEPGNRDLTTPCVGRSIEWDAFGGEDYDWDMYYENQTKTDVWQAEHYVDEKIIDPYFGHLLVIDT